MYLKKRARLISKEKSKNHLRLCVPSPPLQMPILPLMRNGLQIVQAAYGPPGVVIQSGSQMIPGLPRRSGDIFWPSHRFRSGNAIYSRFLNPFLHRSRSGRAARQTINGKEPDSVKRLTVIVCVCCLPRLGRLNCSDNGSASQICIGNRVCSFLLVVGGHHANAHKTMLVGL